MAKENSLTLGALVAAPKAPKRPSDPLLQRDLQLVFDATAEIECLVARLRSDIEGLDDEVDYERLMQMISAVKSIRRLNSVAMSLRSSSALAVVPALATEAPLLLADAQVEVLISAIAHDLRGRVCAVALHRDADPDAVLLTGSRHEMRPVYHRDRALCLSDALVHVDAEVGAGFVIDQGAARREQRGRRDCKNCLHWVSRFQVRMVTRPTKRTPN